ncbi:DUF3048 domain-containing protein [Nocardioides sp.]|uniref:DUF3048 domain-containing protein n=1 Tax=Nocardioides sp. TaxID=35761 RepID=UPI00321A3BFF
MTRRRGRRARLLVGLLLGTSLALAGCSATPEEPDEPRQRTAPQTWPLTGLRVEGGSGARRHPVLVLKMDNTASSAPQRGLSSADLVVEELVEGGVTRLAAFYYSDIPGVVGPVRSMRASDIGIVSPAEATMVTSGAARQTIARLAEAGVPYVTEGSTGFFRDAARRAPYNLMTDLSEVAAALSEGRDRSRPVDYLPFGPARAMPKGQRATSVAVRFSPAHTTTWAYRDGGYVDTGSLAAPGDEFPADSVLVLRVVVGDAGYLDPAGSSVPETVLTGDGEAVLFHGGREVRGTWSKEDLDAPLVLSRQGAGGRAVPLTVPRGRTWIELVPLAGSVAVGSG